MNRIATILITVCTTWLLMGCERRELYVYGDAFHSVVLDVDWRQYDSRRDPDGMTVWFYPLDGSDHTPYRTTTASVRHAELYLPGGLYEGVVIDYSPEEYSRQAFDGLDALTTARVFSLPASYQPDAFTITGEGVPAGVCEQANEQLYGPAAWTDLQTARPAYNDATGLYTVASQPESMALDTLHEKRIHESRYGNYIPYKERDTYQSTLTVQQLSSVPTSIIWKLRIRIRIREGYNYLWQQVGSLSGLADGHLLALDRNTEEACLLSVSEWELQRTGTNDGYIAATLTTFGLRPGSILPDAVRHTVYRDDEGTATDDTKATRAPGDTEADSQPKDWWDYLTGVCLPDELRLNLTFVLRDHATTLHYHFNVGDIITCYDHQQVLRIDLDPGIVLPYVDAYSGAGFGADVTPWEQQQPIDVGL